MTQLLSMYTLTVDVTGATNNSVIRATSSAFVEEGLLEIAALKIIGEGVDEIIQPKPIEQRVFPRFINEPSV